MPGLPYLRAVARGTEIDIHVQPGASHPGIAGVHGEALKVRIGARAVEGAANEAVLAFFAKALDIAKREVTLLRGEKSRSKVVLTTLPLAEVERRLQGLVQP